MAKKMDKNDPFDNLGKAMNSADQIKPSPVKTPPAKTNQLPKQKEEKIHKKLLTIPDPEFQVMKTLIGSLSKHSNDTEISAAKAVRYALMMVDINNINPVVLKKIISTDKRIKNK